MQFFSPRLNTRQRILIIVFAVPFAILSNLLGINFSAKLYAGLHMDPVQALLFGGLFIGLMMSALSGIAQLRGWEPLMIGLCAGITVWAILLIPIVGAIAGVLGTTIPIAGFVWIVGHSR